jgi:hypothetical protein
MLSLRYGMKFYIIHSVFLHSLFSDILWFSAIIMRSLHNLYKINAFRVDQCVRPIIQLRTDAWISMEFGMDVTPVGSTKNSTFQFPTIGNINRAEERTYEVASTLAAIWNMAIQCCRPIVKIYWKYITLVYKLFVDVKYQHGGCWEIEFTRTRSHYPMRGSSMLSQSQRTWWRTGN